MFATGLVASFSVQVPGFVLVNQSHSLGQRLSQIERKSEMRQINGDLCGRWNDLKKEKEALFSYGMLIKKESLPLISS